MKQVKMLSVAGVAAAALMAFAGAGTASATVLCKVNNLTTGCATAVPSQDYPASTVLHAARPDGTTGILETMGGTTLVTCLASTIQGKTSNTGGINALETVSASIEAFNFLGCTSTVDVVKLGSLEIHHIAGTDNGTLTAKGTEVTANGIFGVSCTYGAGAGLDIGTLEGGSPAKVSINTIVRLSTGGSLCPAEARWTASYTVTSPNPLYVSAS